MFTKKRMLMTAASIATIGSVVVLATGATFGLFSATSPTQTSQYSAGTVTLTQPANVNCVVNNVQPGDASPTNGSTCSFTIQYTGSVSANLALDVSMTGSNGTNPTTPPYSGSTDYATGAPALFDGTTHGLQLTVANGGTTFVSGTAYKNFAGASKNLLTNGTDPIANGSGQATGGINNLFVGTDSTGTSRTYTIDYSAPTAMDNSYQAAGSTIHLTVHAVQAAHNASTGCTAGWVCGNGSISWS